MAMSYQFFSGRGRWGEKIFIPTGYRRSVKWQPQIGDIFPDFEASTTEGPIQFFKWAEGHWSFLFSHPAAFTPVCTTEMMALAMASDDFAARQVKLLGFTCDDLDSQSRWHDEIECRFGARIDFPTVEDVSGNLSQAFGMIHKNESAEWPIRKSFVVDPQMHIRMIFEYPLSVGRSTDEVLRCIDAIRLCDGHGVATPADWQAGDEYLATDRTDPVLRRAAMLENRLQELTPYLTVISPEGRLSGPDRDGAV